MRNGGGSDSSWRYHEVDSHFGHTLHSQPCCLWLTDPSVTSLLFLSPTCRTYRPLRVEKKGKNGTDCKAVTREAIDFRVELMKVQSALTEPWQLQRNYIEHFALVAIRLQIKCVQWWQNKGFKLLKRHSLKNNLLKCCFTRDWTIVWFHPKSNWTLSKL